MVEKRAMYIHIRYNTLQVRVYCRVSSYAASKANIDIFVNIVH